MVVVDWCGIFFLLGAYELTARILFVLGVWDRFIRSYGQLDFRVCCGKTVLKESDLSDFILTEQFDLKLHQVLGEPVSPLWNQGINLRPILPSYKSLFSPYPQFSAHQLRRSSTGLFAQQYSTVLGLATYLGRCSHSSRVKFYLIHPRHCFELV